MNYVDSLLSRGEQIVYVARQHIFVLISNILAELSMVALLVAAGVASHIAFDTSHTVMSDLTASSLILLISITMSLVVLVSGFIDYLRWTTEQYVVTDRRVIQVQGVLSKRVTDSSLEKINDVELRQSIVGRMMNFGTVAILTASGSEGLSVMDRIADPLAFKRAMMDAKHNLERGYGFLEHAYTHSSGATGDIQRTIEDLANLRDRGILSSDEFEAKKQELLRRI
ncbi:PH domain-containing protein [Candidatus Chloroploca sp. M-50]|uniref:PH domain-containing protein n=1 Tax=Candidatus Chloroploca mongolica TaxID=2528176 RepID=A0ABS4D589_9CHLR|nr:PH domain-containing protein [Candidatus Chloroploca mongolica]MBP1464599.1 PH domain-containing protein [Candidatus Chloroploca mongolica]